MTENKYMKFLVRLGSVLLMLAALWLAFAYALPWLLPFILALLTARLIEPVVLFMRRRFGFQRSFTSAVCTLLVVAVLIIIVILITGSGITKLIEMAKALPSYFSSLTDIGRNLENKLRNLIMSTSPEMRGFVENALDGVISKLNEMPSKLSGKLLDFLSSCASCTPRVIMFIVTYAIGTFFISASFQNVLKFLVRQFPERLQDRIKQMRSDIFGTLGKWAKSELILMSVTFGLLLITFLILGIKSAAPAALLVAAIDALPVLGTGTVLIPWAILLFIGRNYGRGVILVVAWGVISLVRSYLEPKILGNHVGLHPAATLLAIYVGFCLMGLKGMILFPILLIVLKQFNDKGYIKLWK